MSDKDKTVTVTMIAHAIISSSMMIVMLHQGNRGGHVKPCPGQDEDGHLRNTGGGSVREGRGSGGTAVMRESGGETEIEVETEKKTGMTREV